MISLILFGITDDAFNLTQDLRSLGCPLVIINGERDQHGEFVDKYMMEIYLPEDIYLVVLDLVLPLSRSLIVRSVNDDYSEIDSRYFVILEKLRKHYNV